MGLLRTIVPRQKIGGKTGAIAPVKCSSEGNAQILFANASRRLLAVNEWGKFAGGTGAAFWLTDKDGNKIVSKIPEKGNLIRIKLPALQNKTSDGYDWVRIEKIESDEASGGNNKSIAIRVRPTANPANENTEDTAHFYTNDATSTFSVIKKGKLVWAVALGRNELPNTNTTLMNSLRNFMIAIGARLGIAKVQWKSLMNGILKFEE